MYENRLNDKYKINKEIFMKLVFKTNNSYILACLIKELNLILPQIDKLYKSKSNFIL